MQRKCPRLAECAARGPHSTGNAEAARPYRERPSVLPERKTAGQSSQSITNCPKTLSKSEPRTRGPLAAFSSQMSPASPQCPLGSPSEQSDWTQLSEPICPAAFRTTRPASFPEASPPGEFTQAVLHAYYHGHPQAKRQQCRRRIRQRISQWPHDACAHRSADESPSATPTTLPIFQQTLRPFPRGWQKRTHERNGHERFLEQARRQTRKRSLNPLPLL